MLFTEAIEAFKRYLTDLDRSGETVRGYSIELAAFARFLERRYNGPVYLDDVTVPDMEEYLHHLKEKGDAPASRSRVVYVFRSFYNFAHKKDLVDKNLGIKLEPVKVPQQERTYLTEAEFQELAEAIESPLMRTIITTMFMTGLRVSEALKLTLDDVDLRNGIVRVRNGKGGKDRVVPVGDRLRPVLENYLANVRPEVDSDRFFATERTGKVSAVYINRVLSEAVQALGWKKHVSCHVLRHSFASHLVRNNVNLVQVQRLLGHSNLAVTSRYTHADVRDLAEAVNTF